MGSPPRQHLARVLVHDQVADDDRALGLGVGAVSPARRTRPRSRASTSSMLNGLVT